MLNIIKIMGFNNDHITNVVFTGDIIIFSRYKLQLNQQHIYQLEVMMMQKTLFTQNNHVQII